MSTIPFVQRLGDAIEGAVADPRIARRRRRRRLVVLAVAALVLPGGDEQICRRHDLEPLPAGYASARDKVARLQRSILAIEASADCPAPAVLADGCSGYWTGQGGRAGRPGCGPTSRRAPAAGCPAWVATAGAASPAPWTRPDAG